MPAPYTVTVTQKSSDIGQVLDTAISRTQWQGGSSVGQSPKF